MRRIAIAVTGVAMSVLGFASAASAGGSVCASASATVNGQTVVNESRCENLL